MRRAMSMLVAGALLAGCGAPRADVPEPGGSAVYVLGAVDGVPLPYLDVTGSAVARREITEGMLQLRPDGTFYLDFCYQTNTPTGTRRMTRNFAGVWTRTDDGLVFEFENGMVEHAQVHDGNVMIEIEGLAYRFVR